MTDFVTTFFDNSGFFLTREFWVPFSPVKATLNGTDLPLESIRELSEASEVRCVDPDVEKEMVAAIKEAIVKRDSLGGVYEIIVDGLPAGLGGFSQWDTRLDGRLAAAFMSIPSVKGVEIGMGFETSKRFGSEVHDQIYFDKKRGPEKGALLSQDKQRRRARRRHH